LLPFTASVIGIIRGQGQMLEQLQRPPLSLDVYVSWPQIKRQLTIIAIVAAVAICVSIGKLSMVY
jgi:hypothetical protein